MNSRAFAVVAFSAMLAASTSVEGGEETARWRFLPDAGIAGTAEIRDGNQARLAVECGNGGEPVVLIGPVLQPGERTDPIRLLLEFDVDGAAIRETFECYPGGEDCSSTTFEPDALVNLLKSGKRAAVLLRGSKMFEFTLAGSGPAINRLEDCGG